MDGSKIPFCVIVLVGGKVSEGLLGEKSVSKISLCVIPLNGKKEAPHREPLRFIEQNRISSRAS